MAEKIRCIKNMKTGVIFTWTEILAARNDMIECDIEGLTVDRTPPKAKKPVKPEEPAA